MNLFEKFKKFFSQLNIPAQCRYYDISFWQCPSFLFLIMGIIIIISIIISYFLGVHFIGDPQIVSLIILISTIVLFVLAFLINFSFERLAEANRMKLEFVRVVSHQLRTPLTNLKWIIDILLSEKTGKIEEGQLEYFRLLTENTKRMIDLTKNLLIVSQIEKNSLLYQKEKVSLEKIINDVLLEFKPFANASNIEIDFEYQRSLPQIFIDYSQIKIVFENLLDNAIRYMSGKGKVNMRLEKKDNKLYFEIKDNGIGIPKEDQKLIFQKFFRSSNAKKIQVEGTGLGLYIVKSIIEKMAGKIDFQSEENKGSKFWFTLPILSKK